MAAVDAGIPELPLLRAGDGLQAHGPQFRKWPGYLRLRILGRRPCGIRRDLPEFDFPLRQQLQDAVPLQAPRRPLADAAFVRSNRRIPV